MLFRSPENFAQWNGYGPTFNFITSPFRSTGQNRRNTPVKQGNANLTWSRSAHLLNFGFSFTQVNTWTSSVSNTTFVPTVAFSLATGDPVINSIFNITNPAFPGINTANVNDAGALYALLTGRVSAVNRSVNLDENTRNYGQFQPITRNQDQIGRAHV